jgi:hypothetical protein
MRVTAMAVGVLATAGLLASAMPSQADGVVVVSYRQRDTYRVGFDKGYQDGFYHGERDDRRDENFNFWHDGRYRSGDAGYRPYYGRHHEYVSGYRAGYERGYREAYLGRRHRHRGRDGYCYDRHDRAVSRSRDRDRRRDWDDDNRVIYENPPRRRW